MKCRFDAVPESSFEVIWLNSKLIAFLKSKLKKYGDHGTRLRYIEIHNPWIDRIPYNLLFGETVFRKPGEAKLCRG